MSERVQADDRHDINGRDEIWSLVEDFYTRAFADPLLGPIFVDVAKMDLAAHMPIMCDFWETVLFRTGSYRRNALGIHRELNEKTPLGPREFGRWLEIWVRTVDDRHTGPRAERAKLQAERVAGSMSRRLTDVGSEVQMVTIGLRRPPDLPEAEAV